MGNEENRLGDAGYSFDPVERPSHYVRNGRECIDWIEEMLTPEEFCGYLKGCALKYQWRYNDKDNPVQDLRKARQYLEMLIASIEAGDSAGKSENRYFEYPEEQKASKHGKEKDYGFTMIVPKGATLI